VEFLISLDTPQLMRSRVKGQPEKVKVEENVEKDRNEEVR